MKSKYSIGLFILSIVTILFSFFHTDGKVQTKEEKIIEEEYVKADGQAIDSKCYYLYEVNGYVVVYLSDKKTPYEFTNILYDELPELLKDEIQNGKYIKNTEELYGFLENYSS